MYVDDFLKNIKKDQKGLLLKYGLTVTTPTQSLLCLNSLIHLDLRQSCQKCISVVKIVLSICEGIWETDVRSVISVLAMCANLG